MSDEPVDVTLSETDWQIVSLTLMVAERNASEEDIADHLRLIKDEIDDQVENK